MDPKQQNQPVVQTQQPVVPQQPQQVTPVSGTKEAPKMLTNEWVAPSTPEIVLPQEVKEAGVEAKPVVEQLSADAQKSGMRMAGNAMHVPEASEETIGMQTQTSVLHHLKKVHKKVSDSITWLVRLIIKEQDKKEKGGVL